MKNEELFKHIRGILIGGALGDAMGMPTELWTQRMIQEEFPKGVATFYPAMNKGATIREMKAGQVTDDTINTIFIIKMLNKFNGVISVENYLSQLREWSKDSALADLVSGPSTRKALDMMDQGVPITETGRFGTTNGAAMKISPIGLISDYQKLPLLVNHVEEICLPTHNTGIAIAGASAIATAISYVSSGRNNLDEIYQLAKQSIAFGLQRGYEVATASLVKRMDMAQDLAKLTEKEALTRIYEELGSGVETIETIPAVFALIFLAKGNPMKTAELAANLGGDTDTIGAIATGICGGIYPDFPEKIVKTLEEINKIDFNYLTEQIFPYSPFYKE